MYQLTPFITEDGSSSIKLEGINEQYHSVHGAVQESNHVYINHGFNHLANQNQVNILEVGFGTGLNALLTYRKNIEKDNQFVTYHALEPYPLTKNIYEKLNYGNMFASEKFENIFVQLHELAFEKEQFFRQNFGFTKFKKAIQEFTSATKYNLVYFDAFSPSIEPMLWEQSVFEKLFHLMENNGILVTYCAKGQVKRNIKAAGFSIENLPGPPGKREMIRVTK